MRSVIPEILALLENATGGKLRVTREVAATWAALLERFSDADIRKAAAHVATQVHFGPPTVGHIVEAIEGKIVRSRVPVTDLWNRTILREDGTPTYALEERRIFPDGRSEPAELPGYRPNLEIDSGPSAVDFDSGLSGLLEE